MSKDEVLVLLTYDGDLSYTAGGVLEDLVRGAGVYGGGSKQTRNGRFESVQPLHDVMPDPEINEQLICEARNCKHGLSSEVRCCV